MANIRCKRDKLARAFFLGCLCKYVLKYKFMYVLVDMH